MFTTTVIDAWLCKEIATDSYYSIHYHLKQLMKSALLIGNVKVT